MSPTARQFNRLAPFICVLAVSILCQPASGFDDDARDRVIDIAGGKFKLTAPDTWERKEPKVNIIEHEFEVPASKGDKRPGRVTVMGAGGSVEENIERWYGQFKQPDGSATEDSAKVEKLSVAGQEVHLVDVTGTFLDKPPFAAGRAIERENYRLLGAIIVTRQKDKPTGNYFVKLVGPNRTLTDHEEAFREMIEGLSN
jgi:hypothetical protein